MEQLCVQLKDCGSVHKHIVLNAEEKKKEILKAFHDGFSLYEDLFSVITDEGMIARADPLRHPLIFYYAHTAVFYINKLCSGNLLTHLERVNPEFESMFAIGVDEMSW